MTEYSQNKLCRLNKNRLNIVKLLSSYNIVDYKIYNNHILFITKIKGETYIVISDIDGQYEKVLSKIKLRNEFDPKYLLYNNYVYYYLDNNLYKININGTDKKNIFNIQFEFAGIFIINKNWIYMNTDIGFYRVKNDGTERTLISEKPVFYYGFDILY